MLDRHYKTLAKHTYINTEMRKYAYAVNKKFNDIKGAVNAFKRHWYRTAFSCLSDKSNSYYFFTDYKNINGKQPQKVLAFFRRLSSMKK